MAKPVATMTVGGVEVTSRVNLGQIVQVIGFIAMAVTIVVRTETRVASVEAMTEEITARFARQQAYVENELVAARGRLGLLEIANARTEQKFENILDVLQRIEKRLDQAE